MAWLKNILSKEPDAPPASPPSAAKLAARPASTAPADDAPPSSWVAAILDCEDRSLARSWVDRLDDDTALAEVAASGRFAELRLAAVDRIVGSKALEGVADASRKRDKGVFRRCQDRLRQRRVAGDTAQRAAELAADLRALLDCEPLPLTRVVDLEQALLGLPGADADPTVAACRPLLADAHHRLQVEAEQRRAVSVAEGDAAALRAEVTAGEDEWPESATLDGWCSRQRTLAALIDASPGWLAGEAVSARLRESLAILAAALDTLVEDRRRLEAAEAAFDGLPKEPPPEAATLQALWNELEMPRHAGAMKRITARRDALLPLPVAKPRPAAKPKGGPRAGVDREAQRALIDRLEQAIAQGHLADAEAIENELSGQSLDGPLGARHQQVRAQLTQLEGWARWGNDQARDHLVAAAETLLAAGLPVDELAKQVPALRAAWKETHGLGHARKAQWARFDAALTAAYQPVLEARAAESERAAAVKVAKEALLAGWRSHLASPAWSAATHAERGAWRREALASWHAAGHAGHRHERTLRKGFDALIADVDRQAKAALDAERARRAELVARAETLAAALGNGEALATTIESIKEVQKAWKTDDAPPLPRKDEQRLWLAFRAACDRVFTQRDEGRARQAAERDARVQARRARADEFAAELDTLAGQGDPGAVRQALRRFQSDAGAARGDRRVEALEKRAIELAATLAAQRERACFDLMLKKADVAAAVEAAAAAGSLDEATLAAARRDWAALAALPAALEAPLAARFDRAAETPANRLAEGDRERAERLLDIEIALGLPTPEAYAEARQRHQLQRLQAHFGTAGNPGTGGHAFDPTAAIAACLGVAAPADASARRRLDAAIERAAGSGRAARRAH